MPEWVLLFLGTVAGGLIVGSVSWGLHFYRRANLGLGEADVALDAMRKEVIDLQDRRIALLQADVDRLTRREAFLTTENEHLRARIQRLEDQVQVNHPSMASE